MPGTGLSFSFRWNRGAIKSVLIICYDNYGGVRGAVHLFFGQYHLLTRCSGEFCSLGAGKSWIQVHRLRRWGESAKANVRLMLWRWCCALCNDILQNGYSDDNLDCKWIGENCTLTMLYFFFKFLIIALFWGANN